ncbi:MAG TPA: glucosaminidase domain-containing protein [Paraburkholderia sp.]|jgi:flagellar protein FlgJ
MTYTTEDKIAFVKSLYCPARQVAAETGCSWELILAQAAQETGWGEKVLPGTNNIFNIKADASWNGESKVFHVWETVNGKTVWVDDPFRVYPNVLDSLRDRQKFLAGNPRYAKAGLFDPVVKGDLVKEAEALKKAGYATDDQYAKRLQEVYRGKTMQCAIAAAKAEGCKGSLPTIELRVLDAARVPMENAKLKVTQGTKTIEFTTDVDGRAQIQAAEPGGTLVARIWSEHERQWVAVSTGEGTVEPAIPMTAVTLIAPTITVATSTDFHENSNVPPATKTPPDASTAQASDANYETYRVRKGDTLSRIAKAHSISYVALAQLNEIASPYYIYPGQFVKVPLNRSDVTFTAVKPGSKVDVIRSLDEEDHPHTELMSSKQAPWMEIAEGEFKANVRRHGGKYPDQHIREYFDATSMGRQKTDSLAYCAAFANWCLTRAGHEGSHSAMAVSFAKWGRATRGNKPVYGAVALVRFPTGAHHVTFVTGKARADGSRIATLGGNQGHAHEVSHSSLPAAWVVHYRLPSDYLELDEDYELKIAGVDGAEMTAASTR